MLYNDPTDRSGGEATPDALAADEASFMSSMAVLSGSEG